MANIVKINQVHLYMGFATPESAADCVVVKKMLDDANIEYTLLQYGDNSAHSGVFDALSTWSLGPDFLQRKFTDFPIVHWVEFYDDYERWVQAVVGSKELSNSNLIKYASLVQKQ